MKKEMLINVLQPEEIRIAIIEDGVLEELYVERTSHESYVGNIYKGRIVNIEPSIQAAFVDFGVGRNGFLHVSDVEPTYYRHLESGGRDYDRRDRDRDRGDRGDRGRRSGGRRSEGRSEGRAEERRPMPAFASLDDDDETVSHIEDAEAVADVVEGRSELDFAGVDASFAEDFDENLDDTQVEFDAPVEAPAAEQEESPRAESCPMPVEKIDLDPPTESPGVQAPADEAAEAPAEAPEGEADEGKPRAKRRGGRTRGRGTRGRKRSDKTEAEATSDVPPADATSPETSATDAPPSSEDRPFPMGSAEHRSEEGDRPGSLGGGDEFSDDMLSFSMRDAPKSPPPAPRRPPEPETREYEFKEEFVDESVIESRVRQDQPVRETVEEFEPDIDDIEPPRPRRDDRRDDRRDGGRESGREGGRRDDRGGRDRDRGRGRGGPRRTGSSGGGGRPGMGRPKPLIQDIFKRGQEVLVQVIKEGIGTKGPTLSTYISIAGRYLVLMPGLNRIGVSRKIADEEARRRLREVLHDLQPPKGLGFIIRTAGLDRNKRELQRDLAYLSRLWQVVVRRIRKIKSPAEIYQESDMITRTIRDIFTSEIDTIWVDEKTAFEHAQEFLQIVMPRYAARIKHYDSTEPMFHKYGIETEIARIQQRHVPLPMGGSIVIDQTEALVAIDVNSGNFRADRNDAEETAYQMNLQAAKEIARQLRLRDLGGVIVNDFIDMRDEKHRRNVERAMREAVRRDRARTKILRISAFGIIEMTRQRIRPSLKRSVFTDCPHCAGTGQVKTAESMSIDVMRLMQLAAHREIVQRIDIRVQDEVALYLLNRKRAEVAALEQGGKQVFIQGTIGVSPEFMEFTCFDCNNNEVKFLPYEEPPRPLPRRRQ